MPSSGPLYPSTGVDDATVGTNTWTNPGNITIEDTTNLSTGITSATTQTHYLKATGFGFAIPAGALINGILFEMRVLGSGLTADASVKSVKGGTIGGTDLSIGATVGTSGWVYAPYGGASNLWGQTWTPTDINASTFGAVYSAAGTDANPSSVTVDAVRITVTYTPYSRKPSRVIQAVQRATVR